MKEKKSFKERVMSFLKLDDAGKVEAFQKQAVKTWKEQIEIRQKEVEKLHEKKEELASDKADEIVLNVDVNAIKTIDSRESYIERYKDSLLGLKKSIDSLDAAIKTKEKEIESFNWLIEQVS